MKRNALAPRWLYQSLINHLKALRGKKVCCLNNWSKQPAVWFLCSWPAVLQHMWECVVDPSGWLKPYDFKSGIKKYLILKADFSFCLLSPSDELRLGENGGSLHFCKPQICSSVIGCVLLTINNTLHVNDLRVTVGGGGGGAAVTGRTAAETETTVCESVSTFVSVKLLDIFQETSEQFPAEFVATRAECFWLTLCLWRPEQPLKPFIHVFTAAAGFVAWNGISSQEIGTFTAKFVSK